MTRTFPLPDLGEGLTEAEIVTWLVAEGDIVVVDQAVAEVETAKSVVEVPTPYAGVVERLCAGEGEMLEVGLPLLEVGEPAPAPAGANPATPDGTSAQDPRPTTAAAGEPASAVNPGPEAGDEAYREEERAGSGNVLVGYGTRGGAPEQTGPRRRRRPRDPGRLAHDVRGSGRGRSQPQVSGMSGSEGSDSEAFSSEGSRSGASGSGVFSPRGSDSAVSGSGDPGFGAPRTGVIGTGVAETGASPAEVAGPGATRTDGEVRVPLTGFQKAAATAMSRSRTEIPEATIWVDVDFTALTELRAARPDGPGLLAYLARFVTAALAEHPVLNARVDAERDEIVQLDRVNLGLAVQGSRGLVAPAVLGAERMTTARLDAAIRDLVARTRAGRATNEELAAGTFTLNNYGGLGVDGSAPIINHPQVAMLGVGRIIDRPWVVEGMVDPRKIAQVTFVFDHRVCDGVEAAAFLRAVTSAVEDPLSVIERL
ncbi:2-oxo acid dehydrogenase subunit E2 [Myceligenerans halotolerans]